MRIRIPSKRGVTRRSFVRGAASAPLLSSCVSLRGNEGPLQVGLIGCGGRGTGAAYQAINAEAGTVVLTAMGDVFPERLESCHANLTASLTADEEELGGERLSRLQVPPERRFVGFNAFRQVIESDVDVIILATPPAFRPKQLAYAVARDKHIFSEKPLAVDAPGIRSVLATAAEARSKGLSLTSGFCWRYNVRHQALFERIHDGAIGKLNAFYSTYNGTPIGTHARQEGWSDTEWQLRNWHHFLWLGGDHVVEQAVHSLDKQAWAFRDVPPISVTAGGGRQARSGPESGNIFDHFNATFEYADGAKAFHMSRQMANCSNENHDYFYGEGGHAVIENWTPLHRIENGETWQYEGESNDMYQQEHDDLFAGIRSGRIVNDGEWAAHSSLLAIMTRMSAYSGKTITWEQALNSTEDLNPGVIDWTERGMRPVPIPGQTEFV